MRKVIVDMDEAGWCYDAKGHTITSTVDKDDVQLYVEPEPVDKAESLSKLMSAGATADDLVKLHHAGVL